MNIESGPIVEVGAPGSSGSRSKLDPLSILALLACDPCEDRVPFCTMSIVLPICSICAESAVFDVCSDVAERPWCTLAYMLSCLLCRFVGEPESCGDSEFADSLIGTSRGGGFGSRNSRSGFDIRPLFSVDRARSSKGVLVNRDHQLSDLRMLAVMGGFASMIDDGRRGEPGTSCELREADASEGGRLYGDAACDESELDEDVGSDSVWKEGITDSGIRRMVSAVAGATRL